MLFTALFWAPSLIVVLLVLWVVLVAFKPHKLKVGLFFGTVGKAGSAAGYLLSHALAALHSIFSLLRKAQGQKQGPAPSMRSATTALFPAFWVLLISAACGLMAAETSVHVHGAACFHHRQGADRLPLRLPQVGCSPDLAAHRDREQELRRLHA